MLTLLGFRVGIARVLQRGFCLDDVIGQQTGVGIAQLRLDGCGALCGTRLPAQGPQLSGEFCPQVLQAVEVGLQAVEFADGFFFAPAVFEDTGGLFDDSAAFKGVGVKDLVQLSLADDDVHLFAQTGV